MIDAKQANRIDLAFNAKKSRLLSVYYTAGYPNLEDTAEIAEAIEKAGADLIEIGMPFSDPIADGPTIQESNNAALANGMNLQHLFEQLQNIRQHVTIPIILMGYINPVLQYGVERFCKACQQVGIDGLILPDLPMQEYLDEYKSVFEANGLYNIFLITPQTAEERIREIDEYTNGFIYMVSSASTTGAKSGISEGQEAYFKRVKAMDLKNPTLIGFGISNYETFDKACQHASGAIIGSAFVRAIGQGKPVAGATQQFISSVLNQPST